MAKSLVVFLLEKRRSLYVTPEKEVGAKAKWVKGVAGKKGEGYF